MASIKAIAFDYGGVLTLDPFLGLRQLEVELGLPANALCSEFRGGQLFSQAEIGRLPLREFFTSWTAAVKQRHGVDLDRRETADAIRRGGEVNRAMIRLVEQLAPSHRLAIVTNNVRESRKAWSSQLPIDLFEVLVDSSEVGLRKPDPAIYELLLERLELPGPEVAYIDDFEENLPPAEALGMHTIRFTSATNCEAALVALGIDAPRSV